MLFVLWCPPAALKLSRGFRMLLALLPLWGSQADRSQSVIWFSGPRRTEHAGAILVPFARVMAVVVHHAP